MASTSPSSTTITAAIVSTLVAGGVAYAFYFDYRRRHDVEFRKALKRESKKQARVAKEEAKEAGQRERREIHSAVDQVHEEGWPRSPEEKEQYFMECVGEGEGLCQKADKDQQKKAALCFFKALKVYPNGDELMNIYDKTVPKPVLDILAEMVAYDRRIVREAGSSNSSSAGGVE